MTRRDAFDATLADWLEDEATGTAPARLHVDAIRRLVWSVNAPCGSSWFAAAPTSDDKPGFGDLVATRLVLVLLALALLVAALALVAVGGPRPSVNGRILLARETDRPEAEYFTIRPDGTDEVKFLEASECGQCTFWSPDGSRIMMPIGDRGSTPDGHHRAGRDCEFVIAFPGETLSLGPGDWSPDGRRTRLRGSTQRTRVPRGHLSPLQTVLRSGGSARPPTAASMTGRGSRPTDGGWCSSPSTPTQPRRGAASPAICSSSR